MSYRNTRNLLILVVVSLIVTLGFVEAIARNIYQDPWYERLIGDQTSLSQIKRNRYGIRGREFSLIKPKGNRRIMILGDSFTFGEGVADDSAVFPSILESEINRKLPDMPGVEHVEILNGGIPGSLTRDWLNLWNHLHKKFKPDVVMIVFFLRDGTRTGSIPEFFGKIRQKIVFRNEQSNLYRHSYLFRLIRDNFDRNDVAKEYTEAFRRSYFGNLSETEEWRIAQSNVLRLRNLAAKESVTVGFVVFPILVELNESYAFRDICDLLENFARQNGMKTQNLLPAFMGKHGPDLWVSSYNQHPNKKAHAIAAHSLLPFAINLIKSHEEVESKE